MHTKMDPRTDTEYLRQLSGESASGLVTLPEIDHSLNQLRSETLAHVLACIPVPNVVLDHFLSSRHRRARMSASRIPFHVCMINPQSALLGDFGLSPNLSGQ